MTIAIFNPLKKTRKSVTSIIFSKIMSKNYKVILVDLDPFSPYKDLYNFDNFMNFSNEKILKKNIKNISNNFDLLRFDIFDEKSYEDLRTYFLSLINQLGSKGYQKIIFDCSSSFGIVSKAVLSWSNIVVIPFLINENNFDKVIEQIYSSKIIPDIKKIFYIPFANINDKQLNAKNFIDYQKRMGFLALNYIVNFYSNNLLKDLIKNEKLTNEYKYILKCIYKSINVKF